MDSTRIETERLVLRDWREEDWAPFFEGTNTEAVMRWLGGVMDSDKMTWQRARLENYAANYGHTFWPIERKQDGAILGFCGLKRSNQAGGPQGDFEVGWRLRQDVWGHGFAKEAAHASLEHAFSLRDAPHVLALTVAGNTPSRGLMERLGMARRSDLDFDSAEFDAEGRIIVYAMTRQAWIARR